MNKLPLAVATAFTILSLAGRVVAQDATPPAAPAEPVAAAPAVEAAAAAPAETPAPAADHVHDANPIAAEETGPSAEFRALFAKIGMKLQSGIMTEEGLSEEIKEFDALLAKYADQKSDEVAFIALMKARLYLEVFDNYGKATEILGQIKEQFPETEVGRNIDEILAMVKEQSASAQIRSALAVGAKFPDFTEQDLSGNPLSIGGLKGKVVLVDFWATWCGPCIEELPSVVDAYSEFKDKGFEIVGISLDEDRGELDAFVKDNNMTWPQYFDGLGWKSKLGQQYGINSIPATYLLDREGTIVATNLRGDALKRELEKLFAE